MADTVPTSLSCFDLERMKVPELNTSFIRISRAELDFLIASREYKNSILCLSNATRIEQGQDLRQI